MAYIQQKPAPRATAKAEEISLAHTSFLSAATYDPSQYSLTIAFKDGYTPIYRFVYPTVWEQFKLAPNQGSFYSKQIKGQHQAIVLHQPLKVSSLNQAIREHRPHAKN